MNNHTFYNPVSKPTPDRNRSVRKIMLSFVMDGKSRSDTRSHPLIADGGQHLVDLVGGNGRGLDVDDGKL